MLAQIHPQRPGPNEIMKRPLPGFTPGRPPSWRPPKTDGDTGDYQVHWVSATRHRVITNPGGGTTAREMPLDLIGWNSLSTLPTGG
jgi:hypothetical protein